jgi:hypothetical protein
VPDNCDEMALEEYFKQISNINLIEQDLPEPHSDFPSIWKFSWSYDSSAESPLDKSAEIAYKCEETYSTNGSLSNFSLTDLRTSLFFEQRRYNHWGWNPDDEEFGNKEEVQYIWELVETIRKKVQTKEID